MYVDIYVAAPGRSVEVIRRFLDRFAPGFEEAAEDYPFPPLSDSPVFVEESLERMLAYLVEHGSCEYGLYWNKRGRSRNEPLAAMAFFTCDGGLLLGLTVPEDCGLATEVALRQEVGDTRSLTLFESPPPSTLREFYELIARANQK